MTLSLRTADPAADLHVAPDADLLAAILAVRRQTTTRHSLRRIAIGGALAGAAAVAALVLPMPWSHKGLGGDRAYAVVRTADGSVRVVLRWSKLNDPSGLQAALDKAGARTKVLFGKEIVGPYPDPMPQPPPCAVPWYGHAYSARAVQWDFPNPQSEVNGVIIRPQYFPKNGTFVIEAYRTPGSTVYSPELSFMARGATPSCVYPQYTG